MTELFSDTSKFKKLSKDTTLTQLTTLQNYLRKFLNRGEITDEEYNNIRPVSTRPARAHGLPKIHKTFDSLPPFRPIIDTTGTVYQPVAKYLTNLLNPITTNEFTIQDSFDAVSQINNIPRHLFDDGYKFVSFDVKSLFTNIPLKKTIKIILERIYKHKLYISTTLKKRTLKKLLLDSCTKTSFSLNGQLYKQTDGVSMGSPLGPTLANIIMTEFEEIIVKPLINSNKIKFYKRYVDDTLILAKPSDIDYILKQFNSFHTNIQFTVDDFPDNDIHFLDIQIHTTGTTIYRKTTYTGQYTHYASFTPWSRKIAWIRALVNRAHKICSNDILLKLELEQIRKFMSWNGFSRKVTNILMTQFTPSTTISSPDQHHDCSNENNVPPNLVKIWIKLPFLGKYGTKLTRSFIRKITPLLISPCKFIINWKTIDSNCFISLKDPTPKKYQCSVVYEFTCPGCNARYIGKTDRCLYNRIKEHSSHDSSEVYNHIASCEQFNHIKTIMQLTPDETPNITCIPSDFLFNNCKIIDKADHWSSLLFKESLAIRRLKPELNHGTKASKELIIFS